MREGWGGGGWAGVGGVGGVRFEALTTGTSTASVCSCPKPSGGSHREGRGGVAAKILLGGKGWVGPIRVCLFQTLLGRKPRRRSSVIAEARERHSKLSWEEPVGFALRSCDLAEVRLKVQCHCRLRWLEADVGTL